MSSNTSMVSAPTTSKALGFATALCTGVLGSPELSSDVVAAVEFLPSLVLGLIITQPVLFLAYWGRSMLAGTYPQFHFSKVALPATITGLYWGMGNFNAMFATVYLGE